MRHAPFAASAVDVLARMAVADIRRPAVNLRIPARNADGSIRPRSLTCIGSSASVARRRSEVHGGPMRGNHQRQGSAHLENGRRVSHARHERSECRSIARAATLGNRHRMSLFVVAALALALQASADRAARISIDTRGTRGATACIGTNAPHRVERPFRVEPSPIPHRASRNDEGWQRCVSPLLSN
jgi:hypothetical protein